MSDAFESPRNSLLLSDQTAYSEITLANLFLSNLLEFDVGTRPLGLSISLRQSRHNRRFQRLTHF